MDREITKEEARSFLQHYSINKIPIHPRVAVNLFEIAEWKLPNHLQDTKRMMDEETYLIMRLMDARRQRHWGAKVQ